MWLLAVAITIAVGAFISWLFYPADPGDSRNDDKSSTEVQSPIVAATNIISTFSICGESVELSDVVRSDSEEITHEVPEPYRIYKELLADGLNCDVTIVCGGKTMAAHKALLVGRMPYFEMMFDHGYSEDKSGVVNLSTQNFKFGPDRVWNLIEFAYHGTLMVTVENVEEMMWAADYLGMADAIQACVQFKAERITCDSALSQLSQISYLQSIGFKDVDGLVWRFIDANFFAISQTDGFKQLSLPDLITILKRNTLRVDSEQQIFDAITLWIGTDRCEMGARLLECVRLGCLHESFISNSMRAADWVKADPSCRTLLDQFQESGHTKSNERRCWDSPSLILWIGAPILDDNNQRLPLQWEIDIYDPLLSKWRKVKTSREPHEDAKEVVVDYKIYFIAPETEPTLVLDLRTNEWTEVPGLPQERYDPAVAAINGVIYVAGGLRLSDNILSEYVPLGSVLCLDTNSINPEWKARARMIHRRWSAASCVRDGLLYVLGGQNTKFQQRATAVVEAYDPIKDEWRELARMPHRMYAHSATAAASGHIYVSGGGTVPGARGRYNDFYHYDPKTNEWAALEQNTLEHQSMCVLMGGRIVVVPHEPWLRSGVLCNIESFDVARGQWAEPIPYKGNEYDHVDTLHISFVPLPASAALPMAAIMDPWAFGKKMLLAESNEKTAAD